MKTTRLFSILIAFLFSICVTEVEAYDFQDIHEGVMLYYEIIDSVNHHVAIVQGEYGGVSSNHIIIPEQVENDGQTYTVTRLKKGFLDSNSGNLRSVLLPNTLRQIDQGALVSTSSIMATLTIPENVDTIGPTGISIKGLKTLTWKARNCKLSSSWMSSTPSEIVLGKEVKKVPDYFCYNNAVLDEIVVPVNVDSIGDYAFFNCTHLSSIALGESLKSIGHLAFYNCYALTYILCASPIPPVTPTHAFHDVPLDATIEVPCNTISTYAVANEWKNFWAFEETILYMATGSAMDAEQGSVDVEQDCRSATFTAIAADGYRFKQWSNGSTLNPLTIQLHESVELVAEFEETPTGIEDIYHMEVEHDGKFMRNGQLLIVHGEKTYNAQGRLID